MSVQITVRLGDEAVRTVDDAVRDGLFPSRASYLNWLVERDAMRRRSLADLEKLRSTGGADEVYPEFEGLADVAGRTPLHLE